MYKRESPRESEERKYAKLKKQKLREHLNVKQQRKEPKLGVQRGEKRGTKQVFGRTSRVGTSK